jgi:hypothetical protein
LFVSHAAGRCKSPGEKGKKGKNIDHADIEYSEMPRVYLVKWNIAKYLTGGRMIKMLEIPFAIQINWISIPSISKSYHIRDIPSTLLKETNL